MHNPTRGTSCKLHAAVVALPASREHHSAFLQAASVTAFPAGYSCHSAFLQTAGITALSCKLQLPQRFPASRKRRSAFLQAAAATALRCTPQASQRFPASCSRCSSLTLSYSRPPHSCAAVAVQCKQDHCNCSAMQPAGLQPNTSSNPSQHASSINHRHGFVRSHAPTTQHLVQMHPSNTNFTLFQQL